MGNREKEPDRNTEEIEELGKICKSLESKLQEKDIALRNAQKDLNDCILRSTAFLDVIPDMMFRMNSKGTYLDYKTGTDDPDRIIAVIGRNNHDINPPGIADLIDEKVKLSLLTGKVQIFEYSDKINNNSESSVFETHMVGVNSDEVIAIVRNLSKLQKSAKNIPESETNTRAIIDASSEILMLLDKEGIIIDCNQTLSTLFNHLPYEMVGKSIFEFIPVHEIPERKRLLTTLFKAGKIFTGETEIAGHTFNFTVFPVKDYTGKIIKVAVNAYDCTEQKESRKAFLENEAIFSSFIENSPVYVFFKDENIRPVRLSRNYETMLGLPLYQILGKTMYELFPSELAASMVETDLKVLKEGKSLEIEEEFNGRHFNTFKFPVCIDGKPKYLAGYSIDITEQNKAALDLRESEERFRKVYAEGTLPIAMLDSNFNYINANSVFQETFGYTESELKGMNFKDITHPDHIQNDITNLNLLIQKKINIYKAEKRYLTKDGHIVWGNVQVSIVYGSDDKFLYFLVMIDNITDYKLAEAEIREKNDLLEKLNAEKDKFFSIIAHDLRSPFNTFLGFTELMAEELYSMSLDEIQHIVTEMRKSANNLYRLLENLLEWSMIERKITPFNPKSFQLAQLVKDNLLTSSESIRKKSIKILFDIPESIWLVADENMIATVIRNLLSNAVKFTPKGGKVMVNAKKLNNSGIEFIIEDTGIGMDEEMKNTLFNLDSHNNRPGTEGEVSTGLGLLLCKEIIEKHGGTIRVESVINIGSRFIITFNL